MNEIPPMETQAPSEPEKRSGCSRYLLWAFLFLSLFLNLVLCGALGWFKSHDEDADLPELVLFSHQHSEGKIAVIRVEGVLMEGMIDFALKQIEMVAKDDGIKAIVLRIDSPGGTVSASEELFQRLVRLRNGKVRKFPDSKARKIIVSMGSLAASGGYYIAMPGETIYAERGTLTGSIGVYASLPNVSEFIHQHGIKFELVKAGGIKASGSPFHEMTPRERQPWQDIVDQAYDQFLDVIVEGRPKLNKAAIRDEVLFRKSIEIRDEKGAVVRDWWGRPRTTSYERRRADGGTFTAMEAKQYGLIDEIGTLEDALDAAASSAGISRYTAVEYRRPPSLFGSLLGIQTKSGGVNLDRVAAGLTPRMWYLSSNADLAGIAAVLGGK